MKEYINKEYICFKNNTAQLYFISGTADLYTGQERLIWTQLIRSSTKFEVTLNIWQQSYNFMFKMHS